MANAFKVTFHKGAIADLRALDRSVRLVILDRIEKRLAVDPTHFGTPLRHRFHGLLKLRVSDFRVIYTVERSVVTVYVVGMRDVVYQVLGRRL